MATAANGVRRHGTYKIEARNQTGIVSIYIELDFWRQVHMLQYQVLIGNVIANVEEETLSTVCNCPRSIRLK